MQKYRLFFVLLIFFYCVSNCCLEKRKRRKVRQMKKWDLRTEEDDSGISDSYIDDSGISDSDDEEVCKERVKCISCCSRLILRIKALINKSSVNKVN